MLNVLSASFYRLFKVKKTEPDSQLWRKYTDELASDMENWWSSSSSWMMAQAKEELEVLEALYPNRFGYLKQELKSFIAEEESGQNNKLYSSSSSSPISTQVSVYEASSSRKRKTHGVQQVNQKCRRLNGSNGRFGAVVKRAQACLRKIREVKRSFDNAGGKQIT